MNTKEPKKKTRPARTTQGHKQVLSDGLVELACNTDDRITRNFNSFIANHNFRHVDVFDAFSTLISDPSKVTLMKQGLQKVSLSVLVALHYQFGVVLNEFIAGDSNKPNLSPELEREILALADTIRQCRNRSE